MIWLFFFCFELIVFYLAFVFGYFWAKGKSVFILYVVIYVCVGNGCFMKREDIFDGLVSMFLVVFSLILVWAAVYGIFGLVRFFYFGFFVLVFGLVFGGMIGYLKPDLLDFRLFGIGFLFFGVVGGIFEFLFFMDLTFVSLGVASIGGIGFGLLGPGSKKIRLSVIYEEPDMFSFSGDKILERFLGEKLRSGNEVIVDKDNRYQVISDGSIKVDGDTEIEFMCSNRTLNGFKKTKISKKEIKFRFERAVPLNKKVRKNFMSRVLLVEDSFYVIKELPPEEKLNHYYLVNSNDKLNDLRRIIEKNDKKIMQHNGYNYFINQIDDLYFSDPPHKKKKKDIKSLDSKELIELALKENYRPNIKTHKEKIKKQTKDTWIQRKLNNCIILKKETIDDLTHKYYLLDQESNIYYIKISEIEKIKTKTDKMNLTEFYRKRSKDIPEPAIGEQITKK
ncbi:MAG: hypothetical protein BTN85_1179 [Candidatus Methanohalarchaeum thermophilum]|uniref:Uncharacterized protein n=1 Tax=Methanohalarchaeum thermophilum TaxID=1903181 RepID=A0A1Q6DWJ7_METT1|nr:MAG: hypothetical protein BTN85_1179 [Candidatus Methanohalarchaeum thermophilum]